MTNHCPKMGWLAVLRFIRKFGSSRYAGHVGRGIVWHFYDKFLKPDIILPYPFIENVKDGRRFIFNLKDKMYMSPYLFGIHEIYETAILGQLCCTNGEFSIFYYTVKYFPTSLTYTSSMEFIKYKRPHYHHRSSISHTFMNGLIFMSPPREIDEVLLPKLK